MVIPESPNPLPIVGNPPLSFRFSVLFFATGGIPNPIDTLFQKVSGLGSTMEYTPLKEGGQNTDSQHKPEEVKHEHLTLWRGLVVGSPLTKEFLIAMNQRKIKPSNVLVTLLDNTRLPIVGWLFMNVSPVKWSITDLDAEANSVVIEQIELTYQRRQLIKV